MSHLFSSHILDSCNPENTALCLDVSTHLRHVVKYKALNFNHLFWSIFIYKHVNKFKVILTITWFPQILTFHLSVKGWCGSTALTRGVTAYRMLLLEPALTWAPEYLGTHILFVNVIGCGYHVQDSWISVLKKKLSLEIYHLFTLPFPKTIFGWQKSLTKAHSNLYLSRDTLSFLSLFYSFSFINEFLHFWFTTELKAIN